MSWSSWFRINSRMVARLKVGRLLLGGDAAHIHSPAGAQGMNTGIQDMINLAWKLALVLKGQAPPALLDTYEQERLPVIRDVLAKTDGLTNVIGSENPVVRTLSSSRPVHRRREACSRQRHGGMSQLAIGYRNSPLSETTPRRGSRPAIACRTCPVRSDWRWVQKTLIPLLDPSHLTLVVAAPVGTMLPPDLNAVSAREPSPGDRADPTDAAPIPGSFWQVDGVFLVRPDGYAGLTTPISAAADHVAAYLRKCFSASAADARS